MTAFLKSSLIATAILGFASCGSQTTEKAPAAQPQKSAIADSKENPAKPAKVEESSSKATASDGVVDSQAPIPAQASVPAQIPGTAQPSSVQQVSNVPQIPNYSPISIPSSVAGQDCSGKAGGGQLGGGTLRKLISSIPVIGGLSSIIRGVIPGNGC